MVSMMVSSRQGRQLQRYSSGRRLVVGCIPYKRNTNNSLQGSCDNIDQCLEVLVISSSQKGHGILFPKGGWETNETMTEAVLREAFEEAGVRGNLENPLGNWLYKSRRHNTVHEGIMLPMNVTVEFGQWPEKEARERKWVSVAEAREGCPHWWMREALDELIKRLSSTSDDQLETTSV